MNKMTYTVLGTALALAPFAFGRGTFKLAEGTMIQGVTPCTTIHITDRMGTIRLEK